MLTKRLQKWDTIGIVVPSNPVSSERYAHALSFVEYLEYLWFTVQLCNNFRKTDELGISGGTIKERVEDLNIFIRDPEVSCIWFFQWGDTANQIVEYIDFEAIKKFPKVFIWKSDCDVLLNVITHTTWLITFHGCDAKLWDEKEMDFEYTQKSFIQRLVLWAKNIEPSSDSSRYTLKPWEATGRIFGCNFRCILKLAGTSYFPIQENDFILFLEGYMTNPWELTHYLEQCRMMWLLKYCTWVVMGSFYQFRGWDTRVDEVVTTFFRGYDIPIMRTNEFGHYQPHAFLPIGAEVYMNTEAKTLEIVSDFIK